MPFQYSLTHPVGAKASLGLIVLQADETVEHDLRRLLPLDGVSLLTSRVPSALEVTQETLAEMKHHLSASAALFPASARFDVVAYACTSGTAVIGADIVAEQVKSGCTTRHVTNPVSALIAACQHLGVRRLGLLSPYVEEVSESLRETLAQAGIQTPFFGSFDEAEEAKVARIDGPSIVRAAKAVAAMGEVDALFLSCTNLRTLDVIDQIEVATAVPVMSSNSVLAWHLGQLGRLEPLSGIGRLGV